MTKLLYDASKWIEKKNYYIYDVPQRDPSWLLVKIGRPSGSTIGYCLGHSPFNTPDESALDICCMRFNANEEGVINASIPIVLGKKSKNEESIRVMGLGTINEPIARDYYANLKNVLCDEVGYAVPKFDFRLGVSIDGDVMNKDGTETDGMIEIKCPEKMYAPIKNYIMNKRFKEKHMGKIKDINKFKDNVSYEDKYYYIWQTHYDQMQLGMAIMNKKWCDYVVFALDGNRFVKRVYFNRKYWNDMYKQIDIFIENKINPLLKYLGNSNSQVILQHGIHFEGYEEYKPQILNFLLSPAA
jgi:uncharacterized protein YebE (UPF0316 family)